MKRKLSLAMFGLVLSFLIPSCIKDEVTPLGDAGTTFIKFMEGPESKLFFAPFSDIQEVHLFTFRRDPHNNTSLNTSADIVIEMSEDMVDAYNEEHDAEFQQLPEDMYQIVADAGIVRNGNTFNIHFNPGEYSKNLKILLNGSYWDDLSDKFAIAFEVTEDDGLTIAADKGSLISLLSIKNKWDGVYEITKGAMVDVASGALSHVNDVLAFWGEPNMQWTLRTISPTQCEVYDGYFFNNGNMYMPISNLSAATPYSQYGSFAIVVEFDPETDNVVAVTNYYGQPATNGRYASLDPSGVNTYENGVIKIKYRMHQPSVVTAAPHVRTTWTETWTYLGPRQ